MASSEVRLGPGQLLEAEVLGERADLMRGMLVEAWEGCLGERPKMPFSVDEVRFFEPFPELFPDVVVAICDNDVSEVEMWHDEPDIFGPDYGPVIRSLHVQVSSGAMVNLGEISVINNERKYTVGVFDSGGGGYSSGGHLEKTDGIWGHSAAWVDMTDGDKTLMLTAGFEVPYDYKYPYEASVPVLVF